MSKNKVAAIGTAWAAQSPLPALASQPRVSLAAIASARLERATEAAQKFGAPAAYDDYERMIREVDPDIVYVGGPEALHKAIVMDGADSLRVARKGEQALSAVELTPPAFAPEAEQCKVPRVGQLISDAITWIETGERASPNMEDALRCQQVVDALRRSAREGRTISLGVDT